MDSAGSSWFSGVGILDGLDILVVSVFVYSLLVWFKRTRSAFVLTGMGVVGAVYLVARQFGLQLTGLLLQAFFAVILLAIVIIFQEEIRQFFERVAARSLLRSKGRTLAASPQRDQINLLVRALVSLAAAKVGALFVLRGQVPLERHLKGGTPLNGHLSDSILASIFDPHSEGHDGAVVIQGERITQFGVRLPLSSDDEQLKDLGLRHTAALGLSEKTDALCLVVSEETGGISIAHNGELSKEIAPGELSRVLERHLGLTESNPGEHTWTRRLARNLPYKLLALVVASVLWFFAVHESTLAFETVLVPVQVTGPGDSLRIASVDPPQARVLIAGARRDFYFFSAEDISLRLRLSKSSPGRRSWPLSPSEVDLPEGLAVRAITPREIWVSLERSEGNPGPSGTSRNPHTPP